MSKEKKSLIETYPNWLTNGIFKQLEGYDVPWKDFIDGNTLDLDYYGNRSGNKIVSSMIDKLLVDGVLSQDRQDMIAQLCYSKYGYAWTKAWQAIMEDYDPLFNYHMVRTEDETSNATDNITKTKSNSVSDTGTISTENTSSTATEDSSETNGSASNDYSSQTGSEVYGFDSVDGVPDSKSSTTQNNSSTDQSNTTSNSETSSSSDGTTTRNLSSTMNGNDTENATKNNEISREITQQGNIGVTTSQQMLESELKLRFDYSIFDMIFRDVDKILTINIFKEDI